jgi:hypothetical protein
MAKFKVIWSRRIKIGDTHLAPIVALNTFTAVNGRVIEKGTLGGLVESQYNLSQVNSAWIEEGAIVEGPTTYVGGNAYIGKGVHIKEGAFYTNEQILNPGDLLEENEEDSYSLLMSEYEKQKEERRKRKEQAELDKFIDDFCLLFSRLKSK